MKFGIRILILLVASLVPSVLGHGWVKSVHIGGQTYMGNPPSEETGSSVPSSPIRQIANNGPVIISDSGLASSDITCGLNAQVADQVIETSPGSIISFSWTNDGTNNWIHNKGPIILYIGKCGDTTCDQFSPEDTQSVDWFKIGELGLISQENGTWFQNVIFEGGPLNFQLPDAIEPGDYLLRAEIVALHNTPGEIYPSCTQVRFSERSGDPTTPSDSIKLPGGYVTSDPGFNYNVYDTPLPPYTFPGPSLSNIAPTSPNDAPSINGGSDAAVSDSGGSSSTGRPTSSGAGSLPLGIVFDSQSCMLRPSLFKRELIHTRDLWDDFKEGFRYLRCLVPQLFPSLFLDSFAFQKEAPC